MKSSGLFRIGRDAEVRFLASGVAVCNVALAYNYGKKGDDGNRPTQWIEAAIFDKRAETLGPMLLKGAQHVFHLSDLHIETYEGKNGTGTKLVGRVDDVELTDRRDAPQQAQRPAQQQRPAQTAQRQQAPAARTAPPRSNSGGFEDMDDDIPFRDPLANRAFALCV
jgi:single-strand DNA-binding protein